MPDFELRAFQGQGDSWTITLAGGTFTGTEPFTAAIFAGDSAAAVLTLGYPAVQWVTPVPPAGYTQLALSLSAAQLGSLQPLSYAVLISISGGIAPVASGMLQVYPGPGGATYPYYRCLAPPALAQAYLSQLSQQQLDVLPHALVTATRAIETFVGRPLVLDFYDQIIRPNNSIRLRLKSRPIVDISRVCSDVIAGAIVSNGDTTASSATMQVVTTAPWSLQIGSLVFSTVAGGVTSGPQTVTMSTITAANGGAPVFGDLCNAINSLGNGWGATVQLPFSGIAVTEAFGTPGVRGCLLNENPWIHTHSNRLGWFWPNPEQGWVEINEPIPGGFLIRNPRVERSDERYWGIRVTYRAGYAVTAADIAMGYYPVPEDLQAACIATANNIIETLPLTGPVQSQTITGRTYQLRPDPSLIPLTTRALLQHYQDFVI